MAQHITDDLSGKPVEGPYITFKSMQVHLGNGRYEWLGNGELKTFQNGSTLGKWVDDQVQDILEYEPRVVH